MQQTELEELQDNNNQMHFNLHYKETTIKCFSIYIMITKKQQSNKCLSIYITKTTLKCITNTTTFQFTLQRQKQANAFQFTLQRQQQSNAFQFILQR